MFPETSTRQFSPVFANRNHCTVIALE
jgi:hypothetical protein